MDIRVATIFRNRFQRGRADWTNAFFPTFSKNAHRLGVKIDIFHVERRQFAQSQSAAVKKLHHGDVAQRHPFWRGTLLRGLQGRGQQFFDLLPGQHERKLFFDLGELQLSQRINSKFLSLGQKFVKGAQR